MKNPRVGFIGLGNMGGPMAKNIARAGYSLSVFDIRKEAVAKLEKEGAIPLDSPRMIGQMCDIILTSLPSPEASESVWLSDKGVLEGARHEAVFIELSTVQPELVIKVDERAREKNIMVVDAGVSGGVKKAEDGTLTIMAGGKKEAFDKVLPIFQVIGQKIYHVGNVGSGMIVKLVNNAIAHINVVALIECISVGLKAGIDVNILYEVISQGTGNSRQFETRFKERIMRKNYEPGMKLDLVYKDSKLMQELASRVGVPIFLTSISHQIFEMGLAKGFGEMDYGILMKLWGELS